VKVSAFVVLVLVLLIGALALFGHSPPAGGH